MLLLALLFSQILGLGNLHEAGFRGEGMKIAVIDGGFYRANDSTVFDQNRIAGVYDLLTEDYQNGDTLVAEPIEIFGNPQDKHGTMCLSTMLYSSEEWTGTAPEATYYLIRSEDTKRENLHEIDRLVRAIHLADSLDVDIISISLGYSTFDNAADDYTYDMLNGSIACSAAAQWAARQGRLVCVSAGNSGNKDWHYITPPGDADSILTVGAVDSCGLAAAFSSWGPTADGRQKPEVAALGQLTQVYDPAWVNDQAQRTGRVTRGNGTSFACPEIAGMAACLWQALPSLSAQEIRQIIMESTPSYPLADYQIGYGVPDAWRAYQQQTTSGVEAARAAADCRSEKRIENGQVIILRGGIRYNVLGVRIMSASE